MFVKLTDRFRPRADGGLLSRLVQDAWAEKQNAMMAQKTELRVGEIIAEHLESLYPAHDMAVLAQYKVAATVERVGVRTYSPETRLWDETIGVDLPRAVMTPGSYGKQDVSACGPRHSTDQHRGCKPEYWNGLDDAGRADIITSQDERERGQLPESVEPFFAGVVAMRKMFKAEYRQATDWPAQFKGETGKYPTWGEIANQFPVLGEYIKSSK